MNVRMKTKKMVITMAVITMMLIINIMPAYAATTQVTLPDYKWRVESSSLEGNYAKITGGVVELGSKLPVWFVIESSLGGYHDVAKEKVNVGKSPTGVSYKGSLANYRIELNPYGTETTGCKAKGIITVTTK